MPRTVCHEVYQFDELNDAAKEKAREWYREGQFDYGWYDGVYEMVQDAAKYLGITIDNRVQDTHHRFSPVSGQSPKTTYSPCIWFSGFCRQGDGACFEGTWRAEDMKTLKSLQADFSTDKELHRIHQELWDYATAYPQATCKSKHHGHYYHSRSVSLDPVLGEEIDYNKETHDGLEEALRDFMDWIYKSLEQEHDYLNSDEQVDESIRINEYEFTKGGCIA